MTTAIRQVVTVQAGGKIELRSAELTPGTRAEVIVLQEDGKAEGARRPLASFVGTCQGSFRSAEEVDEFIRRERDAWE